MNTPPKYSLPEIERRWLADLAETGPLEGCPCRLIEDRYLAGTGLRLRKMIAVAGGEPVFKFCKKYGRGAGLAEPITNLYLSQAEYEALSRLGGVPVTKRRYSLAGGALDVYESPHKGLALFAVEFPSESAAMAYAPPSFARAEITHDPLYNGASLAGLPA